MEERTKNHLLVLLTVIIVVFLLITLKGCFSSADLNKRLQEEIGARITAEEELNKISNEKNGFEEQLRLYQKAVDEEKEAHDRLKASHFQAIKDNENLKIELDKVNKLKDVLEKELKNALAKVSSSTSEK